MQHHTQPISTQYVLYCVCMPKQQKQYCTVTVVHPKKTHRAPITRSQYSVTFPTAGDESYSTVEYPASPPCALDRVPTPRRRLLVHHHTYCSKYSSPPPPSLTAPHRAIALRRIAHTHTHSSLSLSLSICLLARPLYRAAHNKRIREVGEDETWHDMT